jgi:hypothetical protein
MTLGRLPILGVSAATLVLVPLLSKGILFLKEWSVKLGRVAEQRDPAFGQWITNFGESLTLPFVLKLLAISALLAIGAKIIYAVRCPAYIQSGDTFYDFRHAHSDALMVLTDAFLNLWKGSTVIQRSGIRRDLIDSHSVELITNTEKNTFEPKDLTHDSEIGFRILDFKGMVPQGRLLLLMNNYKIGEPIFIILRECNDGSRRGSRTICAIVYYAATFFAAWAISIQALWVIKGILG